MNASLRLPCGSADPRDRGPVRRLTGPERLALAHTLRFRSGTRLMAGLDAELPLSRLSDVAGAPPKETLAAADAPPPGEDRPFIPIALGPVLLQPSMR